MHCVGQYLGPDLNKSDGKRLYIIYIWRERDRNRGRNFNRHRVLFFELFCVRSVLFIP